MAWVRLDDGFAQHPKLVRLGAFSPVCGWLHLTALCWCNRYATDGRLPRAVLPLLFPADWLPNYALGVPLTVGDLAARLVAVGLWEHDGDDYVIHDYLDYQPSRQVLEAKRKHGRVRKSQWRQSVDAGGNGGVPSLSPRDISVPRQAASVLDPAGVPPLSPRDTSVPDTQRERECPTCPVPVPVPVPVPQEHTHKSGVCADEGDTHRRPNAHWQLWLIHAQAAGAKQPVIAGPRDYEHLRVLADTYTDDELERALVSWWASPYTGGRSLGLFRTQAGEVLQHLAHGNGRLFRAPLPPGPPEPEIDVEKLYAQIQAKQQARAARR